MPCSPAAPCIEKDHLFKIRSFPGIKTIHNDCLDILQYYETKATLPFLHSLLEFQCHQDDPERQKSFNFPSHLTPSTIHCHFPFKHARGMSRKILSKWTNSTQGLLKLNGSSLLKLREQSWGRHISTTEFFLLSNSLQNLMWLPGVLIVTTRSLRHICPSLGFLAGLIYIVILNKYVSLLQCSHMTNLFTLSPFCTLICANDPTPSVS